MSGFRDSYIRRVVSDTIRGKLPGEPPNPGAGGQQWVKTDGIRFPEHCPGCMGIPTTTVEMMFERNPLVRAGGILDVSVPFCAMCADRIRRRRSAAIKRVAAFMVVAVVAANLQGIAGMSQQDRFMETGDYGGGGPALYFWAAIAIVALFGAARDLPIMLFRKWNLGLRIKALTLDKDKVLLEFDHPEYAAKFAELNPETS